MPDRDAISNIKTEIKRLHFERNDEIDRRIQDRLGKSGPQKTSLSKTLGEAGATGELAAEAHALKVGGAAADVARTVGKRAGAAGTLGEAAVSTFEELNSNSPADLDVIIAGKVGRIGSGAAVTVASTAAAVETNAVAPFIGLAAGLKFEAELGDDVEALFRRAYANFTDAVSHPLDRMQNAAHELQDYLLDKSISPK